jgi:hypothetical protein
MVFYLLIYLLMSRRLIMMSPGTPAVHQTSARVEVAIKAAIPPLANATMTQVVPQDP